VERVTENRTRMAGLDRAPPTAPCLGLSAKWPRLCIACSSWQPDCQ
jgi:hypothetical protein